MLIKFIANLWLVIELLFQLVLVIVLIALLMGSEAGGFVASTFTNVKDFLALLNPSAVAVAAVLYLLWRLNRSRLS